MGILDILQKVGIEIPKAKGSYEERMAKLIAKFHEVTSETDTIVAELETSVLSKASRVKELEEQHANLHTRIETLKQSPQYANLQTQAMLEKFIQEQNRDGKKSAWRDYGLFILGVATPYILNFLFSKIGVQFNP
jgi:DNA-binding transcriptional regulator YbjK